MTNALTEPEKIKGIAVMSEKLLPEVKLLVANNERLKKLKIFISRGTHDSVLRFQSDFHQYEEDHTISKQTLSDFLDWLN